MVSLERIIVRGDSYALRRPLYRYEFLDIDGLPFDLSGCTLKATFKPEIKPFEEDPDDTTAPIKHTLVVGIDGVATTENGLYLDGSALDGKVNHRITASETRILPVDTPLIGDLELVDANGEVFTFGPFEETLRARDAVTNRAV